jgi:hypothetical protein
MRHPFRIDNVYANRQGEYRVVSIDEPTMTVRYTDGALMRGDIAVLARIWENMQAEAGAAQSPDDGKEGQKAVRPSNARQGAMFAGLAEHDFKDGVTGTEWRARASLGGLLARRLSDRLHMPFQSWSIYRRAAVYITREGRFVNTKGDGVRYAKFAFELDPEGARYGFYIERNSGAMDDTWAWPRFMAALQGEPDWLQQVQMAMLQHKVTAEAYLVANGDVSVLWGSLVPRPDGLTLCPSGAGAPVATSWSESAQQLCAVEPEKWCDLYFYARMDKAEAIELGVNITDRVVDTFKDLLALYTASIQ